MAAGKFCQIKHNNPITNPGTGSRLAELLRAPERLKLASHPLNFGRRMPLAGSGMHVSGKKTAVQAVQREIL